MKIIKQERVLNIRIGEQNARNIPLSQIINVGKLEIYLKK